VKLAPAPLHWLSLGEALGRLGRHEKAEKPFKERSADRPELVDAWYNMGVMFEQAGMSEKAEEAYERGVAIKETAAARNNLANAQRAQLKLEKAEENYRRATEIGYPGARMNLSLLLVLKGDYVQGLPLFEQREQFGSDEAYGPAREMLKQLREAG
jgi:tetratricopeptide (TPR) repeat protein